MECQPQILVSQILNPYFKNYGMEKGERDGTIKLTMDEYLAYPQEDTDSNIKIESLLNESFGNEVQTADNLSGYLKGPRLPRARFKDGINPLQYWIVKKDSNLKTMLIKYSLATTLVSSERLCRFDTGWAIQHIRSIIHRICFL